MKYLKYSIILLIFMLGLGFAQTHIVIEAVEFVETVDSQYVSRIPMFVDLQDSNNKAVSKINNYIRDVFMIESFKPEEISEFRWYEVNFQSEIQEDIAYIAFEGEYYGAYVSQVKDKLFFDLKTGDILDPYDIPFQALFKMDSYLDFINKFWLDDVQTIMAEAVECAGTEPYCSPYDIEYGGYFEDEIAILALPLGLSSNCYNHALLACSPIVSKIIPIADLQAYLNTFAKNLFKDSYFNLEQTEIDKYLYRRKHQDFIPNNIFIFGKIDAKYPFSMAINIAKSSSKISGYYYYDNSESHEKILLTGNYEQNSFVLQESLNEETTGSFKFDWSSEYSSDGYPYLVSYIDGKSLYLSASWSNPDGSKTYDIEITSFKPSILY